MALVLLGTEACHLCESAQQIIINLAGQIHTDVFVEDIAESESAVEQYGLRIPVLKDEASGAELDWPFSEQDVLNFLHQLPVNTPPVSEQGI